MVKVSRPHEGAARLKVSLASRSARDLESALDALLAATRALPRLMNGATRLVTTFSTPGNKFIRERRFFELCAAEAVLHAKMVRYVEQVADEKVWHTDLHPAGSFAIVPLALREKKHVADLVAHLRRVDLDHESFQSALIQHVTEKHGLCEEVLDLLAFRAVDGTGQNGLYDLRSAADHHDLLALPGALTAFAKRVKQRSKRTSYLALYVSNAGKMLAKTEGEFAEWLAIFDNVTFSGTERAFAPDTRSYERPWPSPDWSNDDPESALDD